MAKTKVTIRQIGGDDGYQWCLLVDGVVRMNGMTRREALWRKAKMSEKLEAEATAAARAKA